MAIKRVIEKEDFVVLIFSEIIEESELTETAVWFNDYADRINSSNFTLMFVDNDVQINMSAHRFVKLFTLNPSIKLNLEFNTVESYLFKALLGVLFKYNSAFQNCKWVRNKLSMKADELRIVRNIFLKVINLEIAV